MMLRSHPSMHIAVNTRLLLKDKLEGIGWFSYETLRRITRSHPEHTFHFLFDRPFSDEFIFSSNIVPHIIYPPSRHPVLWYIWFELMIPRVMARNNVSLFLSPDGYLSLKSPVPSLPVIHDLNFEHYPADMPVVYNRYYRHFFPQYAQKAKRIATVSEYTAGDIERTYHINRSLIDVVYNGVNEAFVPVSANEITATRNKYSAGNAYFLFVGALHPRKNIANLLRAFDEYKKSGSRPEKLLITGAKKWWTEDIRLAFEGMQFKDDVVFTGRLAVAELRMVIASALSLVFVPYFEGFGIPILEAMKCGVPVITSNVTSMPEVAGDGALICDPFSVPSIAGAMQTMANDEKLRTELRAKGLIRASDFNWDKTAEALWGSMEKVLGINP